MRETTRLALLAWMGLAIGAAGAGACGDSGSCAETASCTPGASGSEGGSETSTPGDAMVDVDATQPEGAAPESGGSDSSGDATGPQDAADDKTTADASPDVMGGPCTLSNPFGAPTAVSTLDGPNPTTINAQVELSADQLTGYFESSRVSPGSHVFSTTRATTQDPFGSITEIASLNFQADTWNLTMTGDLLTAYFVTDQGTGGTDEMWVATRPAPTDAFGQPTLVSSLFVKGEQPFVRADGQVLYYTAESTPGYTVNRVAFGPTPAVSTVMLSSTATPDVGVPVVDPTDTILYFAAFDHTSADTYDIWTATRATANDPWGTAVPVTELNTTGFDAPSWIGPDGCTLFFSHSPQGSGTTEIYVAVKP
jgi:hypothetical protein